EPPRRCPTSWPRFHRSYRSGSATGRARRSSSDEPPWIARAPPARASSFPGVREYTEISFMNDHFRARPGARDAGREIEGAAHLAAGAAGLEDDGALEPGVAEAAGAGAGGGSGVVLPLNGAGIPRTCFLFLLWAATSSFVVVSGFSVAGSFQVVSLPGAAPAST